MIAPLSSSCPPLPPRLGEWALLFLLALCFVGMTDTMGSRTGLRTWGGRELRASFWRGQKQVTQKTGKHSEGLAEDRQHRSSKPSFCLYHVIILMHSGYCGWQRNMMRYNEVTLSIGSPQRHMAWFCLDLEKGALLGRGGHVCHGTNLESVSLGWTSIIWSVSIRVKKPWPYHPQLWHVEEEMTQVLG